MGHTVKDEVLEYTGPNQETPLLVPYAPDMGETAGYYCCDGKRLQSRNNAERSLHRPLQQPGMI